MLVESVRPVPLDALGRISSCIMGGAQRCRTRIRAIPTRRSAPQHKAASNIGQL